MPIKSDVVAKMSRRIGATVVSATITNALGLTEPKLMENMVHAGHESEGAFRVIHLPVLRAEVVEHLMLEEDGVYVDGTTGDGGHSQAILQAQPSVKTVLGIDCDARSMAASRSLLAEFGQRFVSIHGNYADMSELAADRGITEVNGVLLDLGFSSRQVENPGYGLSFQADEPLDMRYDLNGDVTAAEIVNTYSERDLGQLIRRFGEESRGMSIAKAVVKGRPVNTTAQLASIVHEVLGRRPGQKVNPATKTFQALRIAVNQELSNVERGLSVAISLLVSGGRMAVISYHSLEDRIVKLFFKHEAATCVCPAGLPLCVCGQIPRINIVNRRVIKPSNEEVKSNPRSRSARLRVIQKI